MKKKSQLATSANTGAWWKGLTARRKPPNRGQTFTLPPGGDQVPPGSDQQWRLAPGAGGPLRLALSLCRRALLVDIFTLLLAIPGHSFVWTFGAKLPIYKKDTKNGD